MDLRPHIVTWTLPGAGPTEDENGMPLPDSGTVMTAKCRFHPESKKQMKNEANDAVMQSGRIRFNTGSEMPDVYTHVTVKDGDRVIFEGKVLEVYRGQKGYRCDV